MIELLKKVLRDESVAIRVLRFSLAAAAIYGGTNGWLSPELAALLGGGSVAIPAKKVG